jgi:hypothetical protein
MNGPHRRSIAHPAAAALLALAALGGCFDADDETMTVDPAMAAIVDHAAAEAGARGVAPPSVVSDYRLESFDSADVDAEVIVGDGSTGLPEALQGLWWMDGNPLPDKVLTFGASPWDPVQRTTRIVVYDDGVWTWHDDLEGRTLYASVRASDLIYELAYDEAITFAEITPTVKVGALRVRVPPEVVRFTAQRLADDLWLRKSYLHGRLVHTYALRRIVRPDGVREPAYEEYVAAAPPRSLVARRR